MRTPSRFARLVREAPQLERYGIVMSGPVPDHPRLNEGVKNVRVHAALHTRIDLRVTVHDITGVARIADPHNIEAESGRRQHSEKMVQ